jgi:hypothetical protein
MGPELRVPETGTRIEPGLDRFRRLGRFGA